MNAFSDASASESLPTGFDATGLTPELITMIAASRRQAELKIGFALVIDRFEPQEIEGKVVLRVFWRKADSTTGQT